MSSEWWTTFFTGPYLEVYEHAHTGEATLAEVDFLEQLLHLPVQGQLLDVPCGNGRHAIAFARRGYTVTGVDLSEELLAHARQQAKEAQITVTWQCQDMRDLPWTHTFDGAICLWASFGYFDDEGNRAFVEAVAGTLKPGARFVLETPIVETVLQHFQVRERRWNRRGDVLLLEHWRYDFRQSQLERDWIYVQQGTITERQMVLRLYTYRELCHLLETVGFEQFEGYDAGTRKPFAVGSPLLLLAMNKA
jgi:SAM-dependent methyltransferase